MFGKHSKPLKVHPEVNRTSSESSLKNPEHQTSHRSERPSTPTRSRLPDEKRHHNDHDHRRSSDRARTPPGRDHPKNSRVDGPSTSFPTILKSEEEEQKRLDNYSTQAHKDYDPGESDSSSDPDHDHHDDGRQHRQHHRHHRRHRRHHSQPKKAGGRGNSESTLMEAIQHYQENKDNHVQPQPHKVPIVDTEQTPKKETSSGPTENVMCDVGCDDFNPPILLQNPQPVLNYLLTNNNAEHQDQQPGIQVQDHIMVNANLLAVQQAENLLEEERKRDLYHALCRFPFMPKFLEYNPAVRDDLLAHAEIGWRVAHDPHLARKVTIWPEIVLELIDGTYIPDIEDPEPESRLKRGETSSSVAKPHPVLVATKDTETLPVNMVEHGIQPSIHILASKAAKEKDPLQNPLKHLASTGHLFLNHHLEILHSLETGSKHKKRTYYEIIDGSGHILYKAYEGDAAKFNKAVSLVLKDASGNDAILMKKHYDTCSKKMVVHSPPGRLIGSVLKVRRCKSLAFQVQNSVGETLIIAKPRKVSSSKQRPEFELRSHIDNTLLGKITGDWNDIPSGVVDSKQVFGLRFPHDLHCNMKIVVMAAWFLIYKYFFEGVVKKQEHHTTQSGHSVKVTNLDEDNASSVSQITQIHSIPTISEASEYDLLNSQYEEYEDKHDL